MSIVKTCSKCKIEKLITQFYVEAQHTDGRRSDCKDCVKAYQKLRHLNHWKRLNGEAKSRRKKENILKSNLKKFNITPGEFYKMSRLQNDKCKICYIKTKERLYVDHDHNTGLIRGLLCRNCNSGLGFLKDDYKTILSAANYLEEASKL